MSLSQCGYLLGGGRAKRSRMACLMAGMLGRGGGPVIPFFRPAALRRRNWRKAKAIVAIGQCRCNPVHDLPSK